MKKTVLVLILLTLTGTACKKTKVGAPSDASSTTHVNVGPDLTSFCAKQSVFGEQNPFESGDQESFRDPEKVKAAFEDFLRESKTLAALAPSGIRADVTVLIRLLEAFVVKLRSVGYDFSALARQDPKELKDLDSPPAKAAQARMEKYIKDNCPPTD